MNTNVLLLETEGNILKKLQYNSHIQSLNAEMFYLNDLQMSSEVISQRNIDVVVANFGTDLKACHEFSLKARKHASFFVMFVLLSDDQFSEIVHEIKYAHQTLAASCSEKEIVAAIGRGVKISHDIQDNSRLASCLSKLDSLPSPPSVYFDLRDVLNIPSCNAGKIADLLLRDHALAAKVLRVANSGFYARPKTISNLRQAVSLLGTETLLALVLVAHLFHSLPLPGLNLESLWRHATGVALMARYIAKERQADRKQVETSGIAGLLHDLGCLVFLANQPAEYQAMLKRANGDEQLLIDFEQEYFGVDHAELGGVVLTLWGLPDSVVHAVKFHHHSNLQSSLANTSPTWAVVMAEWMLNISVLLIDENNEEILNSCPFDCTVEQFKHLRFALEHLDF